MDLEKYNSIVRCPVCGAQGRAVARDVVGSGVEIVETGRWEGGSMSIDCDHSGDLDFVGYLDRSEPDDLI
jgi:hypothetical protein